MKLTDLSQLTKAMVKKPAEEPKPASKPETAQGREDSDAVLAYFSRPLQEAQKRTGGASEVQATNDVPEAVSEASDVTAKAIAEAKAEADRRIVELERQLAVERKAHAAAARERDRLQGECGRLQGELRKLNVKDESEVPAQAMPVPQPEPPRSVHGLLADDGAIIEVFPSEVREQVLAALADALAAARQSGRERRAEVLSRVLAANKPSGELERRRAELKQILKDAGYFNDPKPLEKLGFKLISGRTHWKLQYANVRVTMSKTPSDYRSNLNAASETANRCF